MTKQDMIRILVDNYHEDENELKKKWKKMKYEKN